VCAWFSLEAGNPHRISVAIWVVKKLLEPVTSGRFAGRLGWEREEARGQGYGIPHCDW
jgi:hypothetical protein